MLLYHGAKALMCLLAILTAVLVVAGQGKPQSMAAAFSLVPVCLLMYWIQKQLWLRANRKKPLICVEATLIDHRQRFSGGRGAQRYEKSYLTFATASGEQIEFEVSRNEFERIQIGAKGPLKYRGCLYVSFRK